MDRRPPLAPSLAARITALPPPVIVFNKSHSGSRLLAGLLRRQWVFMGGAVNESLDALPFLPLIEHAVLDYYPDFQGLWRGPEWPAKIQALLEQALDGHLAGYAPGSRWGWKLCETAYVLPLCAAVFPDAWFVHLIRDGRDVAFSDHVSPERRFWRKIYFGTDGLRSWRGMRLDQAAYERRPYVFNAQHWQESVQVGRRFGAMLGPRYREVRYEALCVDFAGEGRQLLGWLGVDPDEAALAAMAREADPGRAGKHRSRPRAQQRAVQRVIEPELLACGYECEPLRHGLRDRLAGVVQRVGRGISRRFGRADRG
jgi:hypothetical protein